MAEPVPQAWTRDTPWRQGHVLKSETATRLGLVGVGVGAGDNCVIVISHDCDLANENLAAEANVEAIVGKIISTPSGSFAWGKSPRTLHLEIRRDSAPITVELVATKKCLIPKIDLAPDIPDPSFSINPKELGVLQYWLSLRYRRAAFPDPFVARMTSTGLDKKLTKKLEGYSIISAVYFDVDAGREIDRSDGSAYDLSIVLTYVPGDEPLAAAEGAEKAEEQIERIFSEKCYDKAAGTWRDFKLKTCLAISEDDISIARARLLKQWRLEHVSFKADNNEPQTEVIQV